MGVIQPSFIQQMLLRPHHVSGTVPGAVDTSVINTVIIPTFPELHSSWKGAGREHFGDDNKPASTAKISDRVSAMQRIKGAW